MFKNVNILLYIFHPVKELHAKQNCKRSNKLKGTNSASAKFWFEYQDGQIDIWYVRINFFVVVYDR